MNTLEKIIEHKRKEVKENEALYPVELLKKSNYYNSPTVSLAAYIQRKDKSGIIAEFKKQSPSAGVINKYLSVEKTSIGYMQAGASALSILTDKPFFGGSSEDLSTARKYNFCPILRKDFIVDEYQIVESKSIGADAILLIAAVLTEGEIIQFTDVAHQLGLEVLLELHHPEEIKKIYDKVNIVGVNNRDLNTMKIDISQSFLMADLIPKHMVKISESGIENPQTICDLKKAGYQGFLIGSHFMKQPHPHLACKEFISELNLVAHTSTL
ncbi:MAG: indole-3-glycerol phosphate synthase TrpC [Bacteroidetes bacterium]|nr:indole-3-glycerol phosphate synthase TrpC [Bacteroidota bacterium]